MPIPKIEYVPTEADRRLISDKFGCDIDRVPSALTLGELAEDGSGVVFAESNEGWRFTLDFDGRPALSRAAEPAIKARQAQKESMRRGR